MKKMPEKQSNNFSDRIGLVYARVSSRNQKNEGHGLESQEQRCIERLNREGYIYEKTFKDSITGKGDFMNRPAMRELLAYIDSHPDKRFVVIFDDLKRFARDTEFHIKLRTAFKTRDTPLICLNHNFDESPEGRFVEYVLAAGNQLDREQNQRQVIQKQQARLKNGYWPFAAPLGYTKERNPTHGTIDVPNSKSKYVKEALEGFSNRRFLTKVDAVRFLQKHDIISKKQSPNKGIITFTNMLTNPFYAGYIEFQRWEVSRREGHHEGIISPDTFEKNQKILNNKTSVFIRQDIREDFMLRGLVNCSQCGTKLTGANSRSKTGRLYPYYKCPNKPCKAYGKSIRAEDIHEGFIDIIKGIRASEELQNLATAIFNDTWKEELKEKEKEREEERNTKQQLENTIRQLTLRATKTQNEIVLEQYEKQIETFGKQLEDIEINLQSNFDYSIPYRTSMQEVMSVLGNPYTVWKNYDVYQKQKFFYFIFDENLRYDKKEGYRTPNYSLPLTLFEAINNNEPNKVETVGFEPTSKS